VASLTFANALGNGFAYDDVHIVVDNEAIHSLSTLPGALVRPYWPGDRGDQLGLWRPVTTALLGIQYALVGESPLLFHLINVLLHGLVSGLVVLVLAELLPLLAALLGGLVFAVHPLHVEAVANVVGLAELLPAALFLGACLVALRGGGAVRESSPASRGAPGPAPGASIVPGIVPAIGPARAAGVALLYAGAFLSKESAVTLPAAIFVLDVARQNIRVSDTLAYLRARAWLYGLMGAVAVAVFLARIAVLGSVANPDAALGADLLREIPRIWTLGVVWAHYARLLFAPFELSADYAPDVIPILTVWTPLGVAGAGAALGLLALSLVAVRRPELSRRRLSLRVVGVAVLWFLITVSPVSNVLFVSGVLLAERTLYLPSVALAAVAGWGLVVMLRRWRGRALAATGILLLLLAARSWTWTPVWESTETVFARMIQDHPESGRSQWVLGDILWSEGRMPEARRAYRSAVLLLDGSYRLLMEVGWASVDEGDERLGEFLLERAWNEHPELASAPRRLAILHTRQGRLADAEAAARGALTGLPEDVSTWHLLAGALTGQGEWLEAIEAREQVIALGEDEHWQQWLSLANLRLTIGDSVAARSALDSALARAGSPEVAGWVQEGFQRLLPPVPDSL
jgi:Flp pilus assembly protein TadD